MDITEHSEVFQFLKAKGFNLQESTPTRLRFEKQEDNSEITIINNPDSLSAEIKANEETFSREAADLEDLMNYLQEIVE